VHQGIDPLRLGGATTRVGVSSVVIFTVKL
jgi:hypothetical protein